MTMIPSNGNGHQEVKVAELEKFVHTEDSENKAFKSQSTTDALKLLSMMQEGGLGNSSFLLDMPSSKFILGVAAAYQGCEEHGYTEGKEFLSLLCGLMVAKKGKRVERMVDAIVGERRWKEGDRGGEGMLKKAQNWILNK